MFFYLSILTLLNFNIVQAIFGKNALIVIDVQNDFCEGGTLAVKDADAIVPLINDLREREKFDITVFTQDWHPHNHISFASNHENGPGVFNAIEVNYTNNEVVCGAEYVPLYGDNATALCGPTSKKNPVVTTFSQMLWPNHCE